MPLRLRCYYSSDIVKTAYRRFSNSFFFQNKSEIRFFICRVIGYILIAGPSLNVLWAIAEGPFTARGALTMSNVGIAFCVLMIDLLLGLSLLIRLISIP